MLLFSRFIIYGHSMEPSFSQDDNVIVSSLSYLIFNPKKGDVVVFKDKKSSQMFLKRVSAIKDKEYFLTGDNPKDSKDSREIGWIERKDIVGKVICNFSKL